MAIPDLFTPLLTIFGSGIVAALVSSSLSEGKERWQIRRQKAEELFRNSEKYVGTLQIYHLNNIRYFTGKLDRNQYNEAVIRELKPTDDFQDLQMNIYLYQPGLIPTFDLLCEKRTALNSVVAQNSKQRRDMSRVDDAGLRIFEAAWDDLNLVCDRLREEIIALGRGIAAEGTQAERMLASVRSNVTTTAMKVQKVLLRRVRRG